MKNISFPALILCTLSLSACGGGGDSAEPSNQQAAQETAVPQTTKEQTALREGRAFYPDGQEEVVSTDEGQGMIKTLAATATAVASATSYVACATENGTCNFSGPAQVRYGANNTYAYKSATNSIGCNNATFGDPVPGVVKSCSYVLTPETTTASTPPTTTAPSSGSTKSSTTVDQIIADMQASASEAMVIDPRYGWQYKPAVTMYAPRGDAIPSWWSGERPTWTSSLQSWFTAFEAQGNAATNTRIQMKDLRVYVQSQSTRQWTLVNSKAAPNVDMWKYPFAYVSGNGMERAESSGGFSIKPKYPQFHHGYGARNAINPQDVRAVMAAMDFRLVVDDPSKPDDRAKAKYVVDTGADYYPAQGVEWSLGWAPGVGNGRMLLATPDWRTSTLLVPNPNVGSNYEDIRKNPPPLN